MITFEKIGEGTAVATLEEGHICWWDDPTPRLVYMVQVSGISRGGPEAAQMMRLLTALEGFAAELREKLDGGIRVVG